MNVAAMHNEPDLAKMSASAPPPKPERHQVEGEAEVDYLAQEIADSKAALLRTSEELRDNLCASADLSQWVRRYPWAALGVATVAGFAVASAVTPERGQSLSDKLSSLAGQGPPGDGQRNDEDPQPSAAAPRPARVTAGPSVSQSLIESLFGLARVLVETLVMAAVREAQRPPVADRPATAGRPAADKPVADDRPSQ